MNAAPGVTISSAQFPTPNGTFPIPLFHQYHSRFWEIGLYASCVSGQSSSIFPAFDVAVQMTDQQSNVGFPVQVYCILAPGANVPVPIV